MKQAIYRWRGGVSQIFDAAQAELPDVVEQSLSTSRRSCQAVIDVVNRVFGHLPANAVLADYADVTDAWNAGFVEHTTAQTGPGRLRGNVRRALRRRGAKAKRRDARGCGPANRPARGRVSDALDRSSGAAESGGAATDSSLAPGITWRPVRRGAIRWSIRPPCEIILSAMTLADHPGDRVARFHLAHSPLGPIVGITDHADDLTAHRAMARLRRQLIADGYGRTLYAWAQILSQQCDEHDLRRLEELVALGYTFGERAGVRPGEFVAYVKKTKVEDPTATQVRVMTVHQAKGLEFDMVVLPELTAGSRANLPNWLSAGRGRLIRSKWSAE